VNPPVGKIKVLFTADQLAARTSELAGEISSDYAGRDLVLVAVLKGSFIFLSDLSRKLSIPASIDFVKISSYGTAKTSSGRCEMLMDLACDISGRHVLVIEDIVDTGNTIAFLLERLAGMKPASLKVCALLVKEQPSGGGLPVSYRGFPVGDVFVAGYGLDYEEGCRGLPYIFTLES
jgi:hypoxanthine phosphoribosyltransferase